MEVDYSFSVTYSCIIFDFLALFRWLGEKFLRWLGENCKPSLITFDFFGCLNVFTMH